MILNIKELLIASFAIENMSEFTKYNEFDAAPLAHFSFGLKVNGNDTYELNEDTDLSKVTGIIISSSCDNTDALNKTEHFPFPLEDDFIDTYTGSVLRNNLEAKLLSRYGECSYIGATYLEQFLDDMQFMEAIVNDGCYECLPEDITSCWHTPEYEDNQWIDSFTGSGIIVDDEGVWGVFSNYVHSDWDLDRISLLNDNCAEDFIRAVKELAIPYDYREYAKWVMDHGKDPLDRYNTMSEGALRITYNVTRTTNGVALNSVHLRTNKNKGWTPSLVNEIENHALHNTQYLLELVGSDFELTENHQQKTKLHQKIRFTTQTIKSLNEEFNIEIGKPENIDITNHITLPALINQRRIKKASRDDYLKMATVLNFQDVSFLVQEELSSQSTALSNSETKSLNKKDSK